MCSCFRNFFHTLLLHQIRFILWVRFCCEWRPSKCYEDFVNPSQVNWKNEHFYACLSSCLFHSVRPCCWWWRTEAILFDTRKYITMLYDYCMRLLIPTSNFMNSTVGRYIPRIPLLNHISLFGHIIDTQPEVQLVFTAASIFLACKCAWKVFYDMLKMLVFLRRKTELTLERRQWIKNTLWQFKSPQTKTPKTKTKTAC